MFYFKDLGKMGRLGNQMFQYATTFSLNKKNNTKFYTPDLNCQLYDTFPFLTSTKENILDNNFKYIFVPNEDVNFIYDKRFSNLPTKTILKGYFQSEFYFKDYTRLIRKEFSFSREVEIYCKNFLKKYFNENICSIHFRRGDYLNLSDFHTNLDLEYYKKAIEIIQKENKDTIFIVFSDDYDWCKRNLPDDFIIFDSFGYQYDLCAMTMCNSHIIANSSFSWWGAWLSKNSKKIIAPSKWFGPKGPKNWETIYCKNWTVI